MIQMTYAWLQGLAICALIGILIAALGIRFWLHARVRTGAMKSHGALQTIERIATIVGVLIGPAILVFMLALIFPQFARWVVNGFLPTTDIWQSQFQIWLDSKIVDDMSATGAGTLLRVAKFGLAMAFPILGLFFRFVLKIIMGAGHHKRKVEALLATHEKKIEDEATVPVLRPRNGRLTDRIEQVNK